MRLVAGMSALLVLAVPGLAQADVLFHGDFESGDLSGWQSQLNLMGSAGPNITVVGAPVFEGTHAGKIVIHPDDLWPNGHNRVELHQDGARTGEGQDMFFAFSFLLPEQPQVHNDIGYFETNSSYQQSMAWYVDPSGNKATLGFRTNHPQGKEQWKAEVSIGAWHHLAAKIRWSEDAALGRVSLWFDGTEVLTEVGAKTKPDANKLFFQLGYHRNATATPVETIYIDRVLETTTLPELLPSAAGNTGGAAQTAGAGGAASGGTTFKSGGVTSASGGAVNGQGGAHSGGANAASGGAKMGGAAFGAGGVQTGTSGGAGPLVTNTGSSSSDSGCSCRTAPAPTTPLAGFGVLVAALVGIRRRRALSLN